MARSPGRRYLSHGRVGWGHAGAGMEWGLGLLLPLFLGLLRRGRGEGGELRERRSLGRGGGSGETTGRREGRGLRREEGAQGGEGVLEESLGGGGAGRAWGPGAGAPGTSPGQGPAWRAGRPAERAVCPQVPWRWSRPSSWWRWKWVGRSS